MERGEKNGQKNIRTGFQASGKILIYVVRNRSSICFHLMAFDLFIDLKYKDTIQSKLFPQ